MISKRNLIVKIDAIEVWMRRVLNASTPAYYNAPWRFPKEVASQEDLQAVRADIQAILDHLKMKVCTVSATPSARVLKKTCK